MVTLSPIAVPQFDIVRECRFAGGSTATFDRCSRDETGAFSELKREWAQFSGADQKTCLAATTTGGFASYVELLTCLVMARDVAGANTIAWAPGGWRQCSLNFHSASCMRSSVAQNSVALSHNHSSVSRTGRGRCGSSSGWGSAIIANASAIALVLRCRRDEWNI